MQTAGIFSAEIEVTKDGQTVSGNSIMGLMMLAAGQGTEIAVSAIGADADQAIFFVGDIPSVMNFGVVTFGNNENALDISSKYPGDILDHTSFRKRFENSDRIVSLSLISSAMEPDKIVAEKNEIFEFIINATDITGLFIIRGYEEQTSIQIRQDGPTKLKLITTKPGAGFPVYIGDYENPVGQLVVTGSHTVEEAL